MVKKGWRRIQEDLILPSIKRKLFPTQPEQKSAEGRFLEGKLLCEKSHAKILGKKGRRLTEGFSI